MLMIFFPYQSPIINPTPLQAESLLAAPSSAYDVSEDPLTGDALASAKSVGFFFMLMFISTHINFPYQSDSVSGWLVAVRTQFGVWSANRAIDERRLPQVLIGKFPFYVDVIFPYQPPNQSNSVSGRPVAVRTKLLTDDAFIEDDDEEPQSNAEEGLEIKHE
jgi:hypothetical protein